MNLNLIRDSDNDGNAQFGILTIDGELPTYTLERPEVMIPCGTYPIEMTQSLDLTCNCPNGSISHLLPLLDNVLNRTCIRIHGGNYPRDTEGCILVGLQKGQDMITSSQLALTPIVAQIQAAVARGEPVQITIS